MSQKIINKTSNHLEVVATKDGKLAKRWKSNDTTGTSRDPYIKSTLSADQITALHAAGDDTYLTVLKGFNIELSKLPYKLPKSKVEINYNGDWSKEWVLRWVDRNGKRQDAYTKAFMKANAEKKWKRVGDMLRGGVNLTAFESKLLTNIAHGKDAKLQECSAAIYIILKTGLRPGDRTNFRKTANRGVTTLAKENITVNGDRVELSFTGKSYKHNVSTIENAVLANYLSKVTAEKTNSDFVFSVDRVQVDDCYKNDYSMTKYKLKDMRTLKASAMANKLVYENEAMLKDSLSGNFKKDKRVLRAYLAEVDVQVSKALNNTPAMARNSYIHPNIKIEFLTKLGYNHNEILKALIEEAVPTLWQVMLNYPPSDSLIPIFEDAETESDLLYPLLPFEEYPDENDEFDKGIDWLEKGGIGSGRHKEGTKVSFTTGGIRKTGKITKVIEGENDGMGHEYHVQLSGPGGKKTIIYHKYNKVVAANTGSNNIQKSEIEQELDDLLEKGHKLDRTHLVLKPVMVAGKLQNRWVDPTKGDAEFAPVGSKVTFYHKGEQKTGIAGNTHQTKHHIDIIGDDGKKYEKLTTHITEVHKQGAEPKKEEPVKVEEKPIDEAEVARQAMNTLNVYNNSNDATKKKIIANLRSIVTQSEQMLQDKNYVSMCDAKTLYETKFNIALAKSVIEHVEEDFKKKKPVTNKDSATYVDIIDRLINDTEFKNKVVDNLDKEDVKKLERYISNYKYFRDGVGLEKSKIAVKRLLIYVERLVEDSKKFKDRQIGANALTHDDIINAGDEDKQEELLRSTLVNMYGDHNKSMPVRALLKMIKYVGNADFIFDDNLEKVVGDLKERVNRGTNHFNNFDGDNCLNFRFLYRHRVELSGKWLDKGAAVLGVEEAIITLPAGFVKNNDYLTKFTTADRLHGSQSHTYAHYSTANKEIYLSDKVSPSKLKASLSNKKEMMAVIVHEIGHAVSKKLRSLHNGASLYKDFSMICGWSSDNAYKTNTGNDPDVPREKDFKLVSTYGTKSPEEAFAEHFSAYYQNKARIDILIDKLDKNQKEVFNGEYINYRNRAVKINPDMIKCFKLLRGITFNDERLTKSMIDTLEKAITKQWRTVERNGKTFQQRFRKKIDEDQERQTATAEKSDFKQREDQWNKSTAFAALKNELARSHYYQGKFYDQSGKEVALPKPAEPFKDIIEAHFGVDRNVYDLAKKFSGTDVEKEKFKTVLKNIQKTAEKQRKYDAIYSDVKDKYIANRKKEFSKPDRAISETQRKLSTINEKSTIKDFLTVLNSVKGDLHPDLEPLMQLNYKGKIQEVYLDDLEDRLKNSKQPDNLPMNISSLSIKDLSDYSVDDFAPVDFERMARITHNTLHATTLKKYKEAHNEDFE